nr:hypothetical protein [Mangrovicoccus ximenensis]
MPTKAEDTTAITAAPYGAKMASSRPSMQITGRNSAGMAMTKARSTSVPDRRSNTWKSASREAACQTAIMLGPMSKTGAIAAENMP